MPIYNGLGELDSLDYIDAESSLRTLQEEQAEAERTGERSIVVGVKVRLSDQVTNGVCENELVAYRTAQGLAKDSGTRPRQHCSRAQNCAATWRARSRSRLRCATHPCTRLLSLGCLATPTARCGVAGLPLMVHHNWSSIPIEQAPGEMAEGDLYTHCYNGSNVTIVRHARHSGIWVGFFQERQQ